MFKRIAAVVGAVALVGILGLYVVGVAVAQEPSPTPDSRTAKACPWHYARRGMGVVCDAISDLLGMTREEILAERAEGKTLSEIAKEKGISEQQVIDAMLAARKAQIEKAVEAGKLTEEQAKWLLERDEAVAPFRLTNPFAPRAGRGWGMGGGRGCH